MKWMETRDVGDQEITVEASNFGPKMEPSNIFLKILYSFSGWMTYRKSP
jgi:hypothetical protein